MEPTIGWAAIPFAVTVVSLAWALLTPENVNSYIAFDVMPIARLVAAVIVSLASWVVYLCALLMFA